MAVLVVSNALQQMALDGMKVATPGALGGLLGLCSNMAPLTPANVLADVVECVYTGYARSSAITFTADYEDGLGRWVSIIQPKVFVPSGTAASDTARQVFLVDSTGLILLASYVLDTPLFFASPADLHLIGMALIVEQPASAGLPDIIP